MMHLPAVGSSSPNIVLPWEKICHKCVNKCDWRGSLQTNNTGNPTKSCRWFNMDKTKIQTILAEYNLKIVLVQCPFCARMHSDLITCVCDVKTEKKKK